jgi:hypothetical protein
MANVEFDDIEGGNAAMTSGRFGRAINLAGAACSVGLIVGLAVWGYKLAVRDVSGIPVVRALEGPLRIAPENPGGAVTLNQGLSVNAVAAAGTALPLPDKLILAPKEAELAADDAAGVAVLADAGAAVPVAGSDLKVADLPEVSAAPIEIAPTEIAPADPASSGVDPAALPPVDAQAAEPALPETQEDAVAAALAAALADSGETSVADDSAAAPGVPTKSPKPPRRPLRTAVAQPATTLSDEANALAAAEPTAEPAAVAPAAEMDPSTIAPGTRLVQLGAFDDADTARAEWANLQTKFPELIGAKAMVVQSAQSGGRTFFRLRAHGFADEDESRRFCAALLAENASCIPVSQK